MISGTFYTIGEAAKVMWRRRATRQSNTDREDRDL